MSDLTALDTDAWAQLKASADNKSGPLRNLTLCTTDNSHQPQARILILRHSNAHTRELWFHTDLRSGKWQELSHNNRVSVLGYDPQRQLQLRFTGRATLHPPKTELTTKAWSGLPDWTRRTYSGEPPGTPVVEQTATRCVTDASLQAAVGFGVFCIVVVRAEFLDWFQHPRDDIRRVYFNYAEDGSLQSATEVAP